MAGSELKIFKTPELTHRQELILHLLEYSNHLIVVQGDKEAGKTTLYNELLGSSDSGLILRKITANAQTKESELLNTILDENVQTVSFDDYQNWLARCNSKQQIPALIIDDVDHLTDEMLAFLFNKIYVSKDEAILHVCLFCEPDFLNNKRVDYLESEDNRSLHIIEMPKFSEKQTIQYLHQTYPENNTDIKILDEKTIQQIHRISNGLPGRIIQLAEQYLNDPADRKPTARASIFSPIISVLLKNRSIVIVTLLLIVLSTAITMLLHKTDEAPEVEQIQIALPPKEANENELVNLSSSQVIQEEEPPVAEPTDIEELTPPVIPELAADVELGRAEKNKKIEIFEGTNVPPIIDTVDPEIVDKKLPEEVTENVEEIEEPIVVEERIEPELSQQAEKLVVEDNNIKKVETEPKRDMKWLLTQKPTDYVIQLIGAREKDTINVYLDKLKEERDDIIQIETINANEPWHILLYGHYPNRQQAVTAIENLPNAAKKLSPWPRTIKSLQQLDIKN